MCFECIWLLVFLFGMAVIAGVALHKLTKAEDKLIQKEIEAYNRLVQNNDLRSEVAELQRKVNFYKNTSYGSDME